MRYYFYLFEQLGHPVFGHAQHGYPSFIARFIKPIVSKRSGLLYYFERFGTSVQFCFFTDDFETVRNDIDYLCQKLTIVPNQTPAPEGSTLESAFGGVRFIGPQNNTTAAKRAELVLRCLNAVCELYIDNLVSIGGDQWAVEKNFGETIEDNQPRRENPLGSNFESLAHLMANITGYEFRVFINAQGEARTDWMPHIANPVVTRTCRL